MTLENLVEGFRRYGRRGAAFAAIGIVGVLSGCSSGLPKEQLKIEYKTVPIEEFLRAPTDFAGEHVTFLGKPINISPDYKSLDLTLQLPSQLPSGGRVHCYWFKEDFGYDWGLSEYKNFVKIAGRLNDRADEGANVRVGGRVNKEGDMELTWVDFGSGKEYLVVGRGKERQVTVLRGYCSDVDTAGSGESPELYVLSIKDKKTDESPRFMVYFSEEHEFCGNFKGKNVVVRADEQGRLLYKGLSIKEAK